MGALSETIPMLMKKLDRMQNRSMQMSNISENILRIRELIAEARKAASRVLTSLLKTLTLLHHMRHKCIIILPCSVDFLLSFFSL